MMSHTHELVEAHRTALAGTDVVSRFVEALPGEKTHVLERGRGPALVMLHGSGPTSLQLLPLIVRITKARVVAIDRPGFGLSDPHEWSGPRRKAATAWLDSALDALELATVDLLGSSAGGTWALWYALARPERVRRLVLVGAPPTLEPTAPPPPLRMVASIDRENPPPMPQPSRETVIQNMASMGEGDTIPRYPLLLDAMVAAGADPISGMANLDELQALISADGWQPAVRTSREELQNLSVESLLVWGDRDPLGTPDAARRIANAMQTSRLEVVEAGHGPWLADPEGVADLVAGFLRAK